MFAHDGAGGGFDYGALLDELRCHTTGWLHDRRARLVREQRRLHLEELAVTRVLDERGHVDDSLAGHDGTSVRDVRRKRKTAENLESQPNLAEAAARGALSEEQLDHASDLAGDDPGADARWAKDAPSWSPRDLADEARRKTKPTMADALVELCRTYADRDVNTPTSGNRPHFVVHVPPHGPATVAGIPLPDEMVEALRAEARIEPVLPSDDGEPLVVGRVTAVLSDKTKRVVKQRDGKCRWPGCDRRVGLEVHHLWPASWGGTDHISNLAAVCTTHHTQLAPQGPLLLLGNPNNPAGLSLVNRDDLPALAALAGNPTAEPRANQARAGPAAA